MPNIIPYNPKLREFARYLRNNSTLSEVLLWKEIKNKALGVEFKRQVPILEYIVDFYCQELKLAIEVDGHIHDFRYVEDKVRQEQIEQWGITFIRFSNEDIKTKRGCTSCSQQDCASRKLPEKATVNDQDRGEEDSSKTTADISGIAMKGQPTE